MPGLLGNPAAMSEHLHEDDLEERDDVVDKDDEKPDPGEPWAKTSGGQGSGSDEDSTSSSDG